MQGSLFAGGKLGRVLIGLCALLIASPAGALNLTLDVPGADDDFRDKLASASQLFRARNDRVDDPQEIIAAARSDYARLLGVLYSEGFYGPTIDILVDGREAADISPLQTPQQIGQVVVRINRGPTFTFGTIALGPLARDTQLPNGFRHGERAKSPLIQTAVDEASGRWRQAGHAKVALASESILANHRSSELDLDIKLDPGPRVTFGRLLVGGDSAVRRERIHTIAGLPEGEVFDPGEIADSARRLRRSGAFASVSMIEAEGLGPGNTLDITANVVDNLPRRFGFGAEYATDDGASLTAFWMHRNLLGGAENLRFDASITGIGGTSSGSGSDPDYSLGATYSRPATITPDTDLMVTVLGERKHEHDYTSTNAIFGVGVKHYFNEHLTGRASLNYGRYRVEEFGDSRVFEVYSVIGGGTWDRRNDPLNATRGFYLDAEAQPFYGAGSTGTGTRATADGRAYFSPGNRDRITLAGRVQVGSVMGPAIQDTPRDFLFFAGGAGTVRGIPFQEIGVPNPDHPDSTIGARAFLGLSAEVRGRVTDTIGAVAFYDRAYVSPDSFFDDDGRWVAGAGFGARYLTGIGAIRLDVGFPVEGYSGGVQVYVGIGQAF